MLMILLLSTMVTDLDYIDDYEYQQYLTFIADEFLDLKKHKDIFGGNIDYFDELDKCKTKYCIIKKSDYKL